MSHREELQKVYINQINLDEYKFTNLDKYYVKKINRPNFRSKQDIVKSYQNILNTYNTCKVQHEDLKSIIRENDNLIRRLKNK